MINYKGSDKMKYEEKLLIECCKGNVVSPIDYSQIDWNNLLVQAAIHKVDGMLYKQFIEDRQAPSWFRAILHQIYYFRRDTGYRKVNEFHAVLAALDREGVTAIVLKGMYLIPNIYKDYGLRGFTDLDILVKREDLSRTHNVLRKCNYIQGEYNSRDDTIIPCPDRTLKERASDLQHESPFVRIDKVASGVPVLFQIEVHTRLETVFDDTFMDIKGLFSHKIRYEITGGYTNRLSNEDMLIHLCYHNYWHTQSLQDVYKLRDILLRQYMDIRTFAKTVDINWKTILECKRNPKLWIPIGYSLYFCQKIFGDVLPNKVVEMIDADFFETEEKNIYDRWITKHNGMKVLGQYTCSFMERLFSTERYKLAISNCNLDEYLDDPDVRTYFKFLTMNNRLYLLNEEETNN